MNVRSDKPKIKILNINFTAIILILISGGALLLSIRALYQLYKMDLLGKNFWIESGLKNIDIG